MNLNRQTLNRKVRIILTTLLLAWFFGPLGVHRFYTGYVGIGVAQLVLSMFTGLGSIWALVDIVAICLNKYQDSEGNDLVDVNPGCGMIALILLGVGVLFFIVMIFMMFAGMFASGGNY